MEAFPRSSTTIANPDQERIYNPKNIEASLDAVEGGMDEVSTDRDERLQRTQNLWHDMFENPDKDAEEFTPEQKIRFLNNIAESGVESVLSQLVAGSKGFNSFEDAMAEFGVNDHGVPIYGARVTNSIVKPNLSGQFGYVDSAI